MNTPAITVIHGADHKQYALVGKTVGEVISLLDGEVFNGQLASLAWLVNGKAANDIMGGASYILQDTDTLSFLSRGGDKG